MAAVISRPAVHQAVADGLAVPALGWETETNGHDPDHDGQGAGDFAPAHPLMGEAHADGEGEDQAEGADRLHDDQRTPIEGRGLQDPSRGLEEPADQPDRSAQDLDQEPGIVGAPGGLQGPLLLEHRAHREAHRGQKGHDLGHPSLLPLGEGRNHYPSSRRP